MNKKKQRMQVARSLPIESSAPLIRRLPGEDRNEQSRMLTRGATRFSILEVDPSAVVSFNWICFASQDSDLNVM
jgi:hypothetical protein